MSDIKGIAPEASEHIAECVDAAVVLLHHDLINNIVKIYD